MGKGRQRLSLAILYIVTPAILARSVGLLTSTANTVPDGIQNNTQITNGTQNETQPLKSARTECSLTALYPVRELLENMINSDDKLITLDLQLPDLPADFLDHRLPGVFRPYHWVRATGREGQRLLVLDENYEILSLFLLKIKVGHTNVTLTDMPKGCLKSLNEAETLQALRLMLLHDFLPLVRFQGQVQGQAVSGSLTKEEYICNMKVIDIDGEKFLKGEKLSMPLLKLREQKSLNTLTHGTGSEIYVCVFLPLSARNARTAEFIYSCCRLGPDGTEILCVDVVDDVWVDMLEVLVVLLKVFFFLFSPLFIPRYFYVEKEDAVSYTIYRDHPDQPKQQWQLTVQGNDLLGIGKKCPKCHETHKKPRGCVVRTAKLSRQRGMKGFKKMLDKESDRKGTYVFRDVQLLVKPHRLLDENTVPVGLFTLFYNNLVRCQIRKFRPLRVCCVSSVLCCTWRFVGIKLGRAMGLVLLSLPSAVRLLVYFIREEEIYARRKAAAADTGLEMPIFEGMLVPIHWFFVAAYVVLLVDLVIYNSPINAETKRQFRMVVINSLRDMRDVSPRRACSNMTWYLLRDNQYQTCGCLKSFCVVVGRLLCLLVYVILTFFSSIPTVNLAVRLAVNFFGACRQVSPRHEPCRVMCSKLILLLSFVLCFCTLISMTFWFMETITFFVEMAVYTLLGVIVNANITVQYVVVVIYVVLYWRSIFSDVYNKYLSYHRKIHKELRKMLKEDIAKIAITDGNERANIVFQVQGFDHLQRLQGKAFYRKELEKVKAKLQVILGQRIDYPNDTENLEGVLDTIDAEMKILTQSDYNLSAAHNAVSAANSGGDNSVGIPAQVDGIVSLEVIDGKLKWRTKRLLMFLDRHDVLYVPASFFFRCIRFRHWGAPGPVDTSVLWAVISFLKILLFLLFVFVVVMAFGDAYRISSTNQLLATVATGLVPFLMKNVFAHKSSDSPVDTDDVLFQKELHDEIRAYQQNWPVYDIVKRSFPPGWADDSRKRKNDPEDEKRDVRLYFCRQKEGGNKHCTCMPSSAADDQDKSVRQPMTEGVDARTNKSVGRERTSSTSWEVLSEEDSRPQSGETRLDVLDGSAATKEVDLDCCQPVDVDSERHRLQLVSLVHVGNY